MSTDAVPEKPKRHWGWYVAILIAIVMIFGYVMGLKMFAADAGEDQATLSKGTVAKDHVKIGVKVTSIDPTKETATLAITPEPQGGMTNDDGYSSTKDFEFDIVTDDGTKTVKVKAGDPMVTTTVPIVASGEVSQYPNDVYSGSVEIDSDTPMEIDAESHIQAYTADMDLDEHSKPDSLVVNFDFSRSRSIVMFAWFVYVLLAAVAIFALSVVFGVVVKGFKFEFGMIGWVGALLFVLPAVRNSLPGQPPIGTIGDFAVFFWAEILVVISLLSLVTTWYQRNKKAG